MPGVAVTPEDIPDGEMVGRLIDFPRMYHDSMGLIWKQVFQFPGGQHESLVWRKYAPTVEDVHRLGCQRESEKRETKPDMRYSGFISSTAGAIRGIRTQRGHGFALMHIPEEGLHHIGVFYAPDGGASPTSLKPGDKGELKLALGQVFGDLIPHSCAEPAPN
jgi:hypothetical protein